MSENQIIIGNIVLLIACVIMVIAGLPKKKITCLILQNTQILIASVGNLILGSYPGFIINILSIIRNILSQQNFSCLCWAIHDFSIYAYTAGISDIITIIANLIGLYRVQKNKKINKRTIYFSYERKRFLFFFSHSFYK